MSAKGLPGHKQGAVEAAAAASPLPPSLLPLCRRPPRPDPFHHLAGCRWEDGELVQKTLTEPNRWEVHSAEEVAVTLGDLRLRILQQPHQLAGAGANPDKLGVAAALWDGALVLAAYLAAQPRYRYLGACVRVCVRRCCVHCPAGSWPAACERRYAALPCMHDDACVWPPDTAEHLSAGCHPTICLQACAAWSWAQGWAWWAWRWQPWELE